MPEFNFDKEGKRSRAFGSVGAIGGLDQNVNELDLLNGTVTYGNNKYMSRAERGWRLRESNITKCLLILNTEGISDEERRHAVITLGRYYAFDLWKMSQITSDLAYLQKEQERYQALLEEHQHVCPEAMEFARDFENNKR